MLGQTILNVLRDTQLLVLLGLTCATALVKQTRMSMTCNATAMAAALGAGVPNALCNPDVLKVSESQMALTLLVQ